MTDGDDDDDEDYSEVFLMARRTPREQPMSRARYTGPGEKRKRWPQLSAAVVQAASVKEELVKIFVQVDH